MTKEKKREKMFLDFKKFKRFLKETGKYKFIISYLFPQERCNDDFFKCWEQKGYSISNILNYDDILGPSYKKLGFTHWLENISEITSMWQERYRKKDFNYE